MKFCPSRPSARSGFSLIEVLISTSVLMVIVVLVSIVFQQSNGAFRQGRNKVQAQTILRSVFGILTRDLAMAVADGENSWGPNSITFCVPTGESVEYITYTINGNTLTRSVKGGEDATITDSIAALSFSFEPESPQKGTLPKRVDIVAYAYEDGASSSYVGGHSRGPDGVSGTDDDIWVGKKN